MFDWRKAFNLISSQDHCQRSSNIPKGFSSLKDKIHKLNIANLNTIPIDLSKISNEAKNKVVKKNEYSELVKNANAIDDSRLVKNRL